MKRTFLFFVALTSAATLFAQHTHTEFGIKGGLNVSNLTSKVTSGNTTVKASNDAKAGFNAGILAHVHLNKQWAIQPELVYSLEGSQYRNTSNQRVNRNLSYLNLPILVQYMVLNGLRIQTGPQAGLLLSANDKLNSNKNSVKQYFANAAFSWTAGLGYLTKSGLGIDARYNFGLSNLDASDISKVHSNVLQVGLFYQFKD
jgi:Outer membrane protein beta-barrel domain